MANKSRSPSCILGLAPCTRGVGFAVMSKLGVLLDWGVKRIRKESKNILSIHHMLTLIGRYNPCLVAVEDQRSTKRKSRIKTLLEEIAEVVSEKGIKLQKVSRTSLRKKILGAETGTNHSIAERLAEIYPEELRPRLPKKRRLWTAEAYQMDFFHAVALAFCAVKRSRVSEETSQTEAPQKH